MASDAEQIRDRFLAERNYIQQYVDFVFNASDIPDHVIRDINQTLQSHGLAELPDRPGDRLEFYYSAAELESLISAMTAVRPAIQETAALLKREAPISQQREFDDPHEAQLLSEWEGWMIQHLPDIPAPNDVAEIVNYAFTQAEQQTDMEILPETLREIIAEAAHVAVRIKAESRIAGLEVALERFETLSLVAHVAMPSAEINIMRQGFILLMTAFDAAIFDLTRLALKKKFSELIGQFGKNEKLSLEKIGSFGTLDSLRDYIIEGQLKARYVKDLLFLLKSFGVKCVDPTKSENFGDLIELVLRRNVHVHNRGVVDERYLEKDEKETERFNVHILAIGELAVIDEGYWELASRLSSDCVEAVTAWVDQ